MYILYKEYHRNIYPTPSYVNSWYAMRFKGMDNKAEKSNHVD